MERDCYVFVIAVYFEGWLMGSFVWGGRGAKRVDGKEKELG